MYDAITSMIIITAIILFILLSLLSLYLMLMSTDTSIIGVILFPVLSNVVR